MEEEILAELKRLRQDLEVGAAINIIEGINTIETLAVLGHWIQVRRPPTEREVDNLSQTARARWALQVRHVLSLMRADGTDLDEKMADLADMLAKSKPTKTHGAKPTKTRKSGKRKARR